MPFSLARSAISLPTSFAEATLPPVGRFSPFAAPLPFSTVPAETRVTPLASSMTCAYRWLTERYTLRRGRSVVPAIFLRIRVWILVRVLFFDVFPIISVSFIPGFYTGGRRRYALP